MALIWPIIPARYFNQRLLKVFCIRCRLHFCARSIYEQQHQRSSINFAIHKIKSGTLTAGTVKSNLKGTVERFFVNENDFPFMS